MFRITVVLLLALSLHSVQGGPEYILSPTLPPTAFLGQYYTCDFRVAGLTNPKYTFSNLPRFFKSSSSGRIEGTPTEKGTFTISVTYQDNQASASKSVVLRITDPDSSKQVQVKEVVHNINDIELIPCIYSEGQEVFINLTNYVAGNHTWVYEHLPLSLQGTPEGCIKGKFSNKGMYSFASICSDLNGVSSNYIFTLNIQPTYYGSNDYFGYSNFRGQSELEAVPVRDTCECNNLVIENLQQAAKIAVEKARKEVSEFTLKVNFLRGELLKINSDAALAEKTLKIATILRDRMLIEQAKIMKKTLDAQELFRTVNNTYELHVTNYNEHLRAVKTAQYDVKCAEDFLEAKKQALDRANDVFIRAQKASAEVCVQIQKINLDIIAGKKDVSAMFDLVKDAKERLLKAQKSNTDQNFDIQNMKTDRDIANMENDIAVSQLHTKQSILDKAQDDLKNANGKVVDLRALQNDAKNNLGVSNFNLLQAMNSLLVAQAAKEQADKALALASAEAVKRDTGNNTYIFSGCEIGAYPTFAGSARISKVYEGRAVLDNGQVILYGACTQMEPLKEGEVVQFDGYYRSGCIHGVSLSKSS